MPTDLRHLDATINNLRAAGAGIADAVAYLTVARDNLATSSGADRQEAERALAGAELQMRTDAAVLAHDLAALAMPAASVPT